MINISPKKLYVEQTDGKLKAISKLSIRDTEEFRQLLNELNHEVTKECYQNLSFSAGYISQPIFTNIIDRLLALVGLSVDLIDSDSLFNLLFPHELPDGSYERQGLLVRHILGEIKGGSSVDAESVNYYAKLIGDLWASTSNLKDVLLAIDEFDYDSVVEVLKYKAEALKPTEEKDKATNIAKAKAELVKLKSVNIGEEIELS